MTKINLILAALFLSTSLANAQGLIESDRILGRDSPGTGQVEQLTLGSGLGFTGTKSIEIPDSSLGEAKLDAIDSPNDEDCLTYETTVGDFEWQVCGSGGGGVSDGTYGDIVVSSAGMIWDVVIGTGGSVSFADATSINDASNNELLVFQSTASAVNYIDLTNAATGNNPDIAATGGDTNIALEFTAKGIGEAHTANSADRFIFNAGANAFKGGVVLRGTDAGPGQPGFTTWHDTVSPALSDWGGGFTMAFTDTGGTFKFGGGFGLHIEDPTAGSEDTMITFQTKTAGDSDRFQFHIGNGVIIGAGTDVPSAASPGYTNAYNNMPGRGSMLMFADTTDTATITGYGADTNHGLRLRSKNTGATLMGRQTSVYMDGQTRSGPIFAFYGTSNNDANGVFVDLNTDSASPVADDLVGTITFRGKDAAAGNVGYATMFSQIRDTTDTSEDGILSFGSIIAGVGATVTMRTGSPGGVAIGDVATSGLPGRGTLRLADSAPVGGAGGAIRFGEDTDNGVNFLTITAPAIVGSNQTCTLENDADFIPDSCVGDGVDDTGAAGTVTVSGTPVNNQVAVWTTAVEIEGDTAFTFDTTTDILTVGGDVSIGDDLSLTSTGALINIGPASDCVITHSSNTLTLTGCTAVGFGSAPGDADYGDVTVTGGVWAIDPDSVALGTDTTGNYVDNVTGGSGITVTHTPGEGSEPDVVFAPSEINLIVWGSGTFTTEVFDAGATDPTWTYGSNSVALTNAATFTVNGVSFQPLDADLTSWAGVTRAAGFDTFATTPSMANLGSLLTDDAAGWTTFGTTPTSANLRTLLTDEVDTGVLVFLGTPADDQVSVGDSATDTTWRTVPDSDGATQKLQYDQATNTFSAGTDDDVPEVGDFTALVGGTGITNSAGTLSVDGTELGTVTWGAGATVTWTYDVGATDLVATYATPATLTYSGGGTSPIIQIDDAGSLKFYEEDAGGTENFTFVAPATMAASFTCTFDNTTGRIPDSCVGDGTDAAGGGTVTASGTPVDNQIAVWTSASAIEGDTALTFDTATDALSIGTAGVFTTGTIELGHASANTLDVSGGALRLEGVALLTATSADALFLTPAEGNAAYQPLDADLTSWALITRTAAFDTLAAATANSAALRAYLSDEIGTGVLVFLGTPADDQVPVGDSASATTWRTVADSDAATQKLQYDQATNTFSAGTDDDVPESGDYVNLTGGSGITVSSGTIDFAPTELATVTWGTANFTTMTFDAGADDTTFEVASGSFTIDIDGINELTLTPTAFSPGVDAGQTLGTTALAWNDLHLDTGATINIENGDWLATHTTGILTVTTGDLRVTNAGTNTASVVTVGGTQTLTAKTLTSPTINGATIDSTSTVAIGATTESNIEAALDTLANVTSIGGDVTAGGDFISTDDTFVGDDLSLTTNGALINIGAANDCVITHSTNTLTLTGCTAVGFGAPTDYVATVADGTGIDGTATGAASTYTPTLDLTEISESAGIDLLATTISFDATELGTVTWGAAATITWTFDVGATDFVETYTNPGTVTYSAGGTSPIVNIDDAGILRILEEDAGGSNYFELVGPATLGANFTCTIDSATGRIPDSCVGDGTDGGGGGSQTPWTSDIDADQFSLTDLDSIEWGTGTDTTMTKSSNGNVSIEGEIVKHTGEQTVILLSGAGTSPTGATPVSCSPTAFIDSGTNDIFNRTCFYSATADNALLWTIPMPKSADESVDLQAQVIWTQIGTLDASDDVIWGFSCVAISDDDGMNATAFPAEDTVTDTALADGDLMMSGRITGITPGGTWTENDILVCRLIRDANAGGDTLGNGAQLISVKLFYQDNAASDD